MTKEKQIEEMIEHVREVTDDCQNCNLYKDRLCDYNCDLCEAIQLACEALYNAGYRKQSEVINEFADRLKNTPIKCGLPLLGLSTKGEIEEYFDGIMLQIKDAIDSIVKEMLLG